MPPEEIDIFLSRIISMSRLDLIKTLRTMRCAFAIDFTDEFLNSISIERLRHIVIAAREHDRVAKTQVPA